MTTTNETKTEDERPWCEECPGGKGQGPAAARAEFRVIERYKESGDLFADRWMCRHHTDGVRRCYAEGDAGAFELTIEPLEVGAALTHGAERGAALMQLLRGGSDCGDPKCAAWQAALRLEIGRAVELHTAAEQRAIPVGLLMAAVLPRGRN